MRLKLVGIVGDPIRHSLSPVMQNACFLSMGLPYLYLPFHVTKAELGRFFRDRPTRLAGLNVTIPHKESVLKYLDRIDPIARGVGAVNTVVIRGGRLYGYNTDVPGYLLSLRVKTGLRLRRKSALVLGSGGAARAVLYALSLSGAGKIYIANRTLSRARSLARSFRRRFPETEFLPLPLEERRLESPFSTVDLLVNTTSVGLDRTGFKDLPSFSRFSRKGVVSDLVYSPRLTPLLREAKRYGRKIHEGWGMLLYQGALSFRLWTGRRPKIGVMKRALLAALA